jgi:hypothetical protein
MKNLIEATILIRSVLFSNAISTTDGVISVAARYSYISLGKHPFLCRNKQLEAIRDCIGNLTEGYNAGYVGIFANLNGKRVDKLTSYYIYLNSL